MCITVTPPIFKCNSINDIKKMDGRKKIRELQAARENLEFPSSSTLSLNPTTSSSKPTTSKRKSAKQDDKPIQKRPKLDNIPNEDHSEDEDEL